MRITVALVLSVLAIAGAVLYASESQRKVVVLYYLGHLTVAEIAHQENVAEGTVKSWLSRGRATLAGQLSGGN